jgi:iron complex transport system substrate-binding protein
MVRIRHLSLALVAILIVMAVLTGCGTNETTNTTATGSGNQAQADQLPATEATEATEADKDKDQAASEALAQQDEVRVIEHAMGSTEIKGTPTRVVTLFQGATDVTVALGVQPVGVIESWAEQPVYEYLRESLKDVPIVGVETQPNLEEVSKLKPDLIIASMTRHEKIYEQLSQIAPTLIIDPLYAFKNTTNILGEALNKQAEAEQLINNWDKRVTDFKGKIQASLGSEWPMEVSVLNFRADHARIYVTGFAGDILEELGFIRSDLLQAEADKGTVVMRFTTIESIPTMNADAFFIFNYDSDGDQAVKQLYEEWTGHPLWKDLDAVKNDNVSLVNEVTWNLGGGILSANLMLDDLYKHFGLEE